MPDPAALVVRAVGEVDAATVPEWRSVLHPAVRAVSRVGAEARASPLLVADLSAVTFLGASGLAVLVDVLERAVEHGVVLRAVAARRSVRRPLEITGLDRRLLLVDRLDLALCPGDRCDPAGVASSTAPGRDRTGLDSTSGDAR